MTRWLDPEEQQTWRAFLGATQLVFEQLDRELQRDSSIPHGYYEILVRLSEAPERSLRMSALADRSQSSRSRLSHAVARLEDKGWVRRETCASDKRGQIARLTDQGFAALAAAAPGHVAGVRRHVFDPLTPDQVRQLREISTRLVEALQPEPECLATVVGQAPTASPVPS
ncbi:MAG: regulatory protein marr [Frankiales bacterium]|nr:regulatory protein marr [Frankiales bacterium]